MLLFSPLGLLFTRLSNVATNRRSSPNSRKLSEEIVCVYYTNNHSVSFTWLQPLPCFQFFFKLNIFCTWYLLPSSPIAPSSTFVTFVVRPRAAFESVHWSRPIPLAVVVTVQVVFEFGQMPVVDVPIPGEWWMDHNTRPSVGIGTGQRIIPYPPPHAQISIPPKVRRDRNRSKTKRKPRHSLTGPICVFGLPSALLRLFGCRSLVVLF
jgi:hypothetical protein